MNAPSGVVTFLFTDIEGSTRRWESDADAMRVVLAAHDKVLRSAIEANDGFVFSHTGDGMVAAFASPMSAVDAAIDAQRELELPVRMGIATGEAEFRDNDYFGTMLNRAARIMAAGHGGQILVADSTRTLLNDIDLEDLGSRRLRDVPNPVGLFQVRAPGLRTDFPPLRTLDARPGNLRPAVTSLIGRGTEVSDITAALRAHRLVTLTGVGGVGKTRLATEVAAQCTDEFPDGVWFFELAAVDDAAAVPDAIATVLGITQQPGKTVGESVAAALEVRSRLLVFDNCEHVLDAAADLVELIVAQSATVKILATSREGLGVADEQVWPVPSLDAEPAADLFVERARSVAPRSALDHVAVVEICRRLDGIPLAIELAASRMASMTATEVRDRLDDRFRLLVGARRSLERHQTLRHAVAWSYDLLDDAEKSLLNRCSVFAGGFQLESACAVAAFDDSYAALDLVDALVRKSLLVADRSSGRTRFSMLETIRQFAEEQLVSRGEATETRTAHALHFAARENDIIPLWDGPNQREAYDWFNAELPNLRTAFRWAADNDDLDCAATVATLAGFLGVWVEIYEPAVWAEELIESARMAGHPRLVFLYLVATMCHFAGRVDAGLRYLEAARTELRQGAGELPCDIATLFGAGVYLAIGRPDQWAELCRARLGEGRDTHTFSAASLVMALMSMDQLDQAIVATHGLIDAAEATDNPAALSYALLAYGTAYQEADPARSLTAVRRGLRVAQDNGGGANESVLAMTLCKFETECGDPAAALDSATLAIRNYRDSGNVTVIGVPLANLAYLLDRIGRYEAAATILGHAFTPMTAATTGVDATIAHLRDVLGSAEYESLVRNGETMSTAEIATYAYDQIDQARTQLEQSP